MKFDRPVVYVSVDSLLVPSDKHDTFLDAGIAEYAAPFMNWCAGTYRTILLSDRPVAHATYLFRHLGLSPAAVPIKPYLGLKIDNIDPQSNFYLIDDALIPGEVSWFLEHGLQDRLIGVNPHIGVSLETRHTLEARTHARRR